MTDSVPQSPTSTLRADSPSSLGSWSSDSTLVNAIENGSVDSYALASAILTGDVALVETLSRQQTQLARTDTWVLYEACLQGQAMLRALLLNLRLTFSITLPYCEGDTLLHFILRTPAARFCDRKRDVVKLLLLNGANPLQCDRLGDTILHSLAGNVWLEPNSENTEGYVLLNLLLHDTELEGFRLACLQDIDTQNNYGNTPLVIATLYNHVEYVRLLLESGANVNVRGEFGKSALDFAVDRGYTDIFNLLKHPERCPIDRIQ